MKAAAYLAVSAVVRRGQLIRPQSLVGRAGAGPHHDPEPSTVVVEALNSYGGKGTSDRSLMRRRNGRLVIRPFGPPEHLDRDLGARGKLVRGPAHHCSRRSDLSAGDHSRINRGTVWRSFGNFRWGVAWPSELSPCAWPREIGRS